MTTAKCSECGANIIREAKFCPKCGVPAPEPSADEDTAGAYPERNNERQSIPLPKRAVAAPPPRMARPSPPKLPPQVEKTVGTESRQKTSKTFWLLLVVIGSIALAAGAFWQRDLIFGTTDPEMVEQSNSISSPSETQTDVSSQLPTVAEDPLEQGVFPEQPAYNESADGGPAELQEAYPPANTRQRRSNGYSDRQRYGQGDEGDVSISDGPGGTRIQAGDLVIED
jgi:hypothetical protein